MEVDSYFDGRLSQLIGIKMVGVFITIFTFGLCYPWAKCMVYDWEVTHTVIEGRRLKFNGTGLSLFGLWIKWFVLCILTLGIYSFWIALSLKKWKTENTSFE